MPATEQQKKAGTAQGFLLYLLGRLEALNAVASSQMGEGVAIATVTAHNGDRFNITVHKIASKKETG